MQDPIPFLRCRKGCSERVSTYLRVATACWDRAWGAAPCFMTEIRDLCNPFTALRRSGESLLSIHSDYWQRQGPREIIPEVQAIWLELAPMCYTPDPKQAIWTHQGLCHNRGCAREWSQWWGHPNVATNRPRFHSLAGCPNGQVSEGPISIPGICFWKTSVQDNDKKLVIWKAWRCFIIF